MSGAIQFKIVGDEMALFTEDADEITNFELLQAKLKQKITESIAPIIDYNSPAPRPFLKRNDSLIKQDVTAAFHIRMEEFDNALLAADTLGLNLVQAITYYNPKDIAPLINDGIAIEWNNIGFRKLPHEEFVAILTEEKGKQIAFVVNREEEYRALQDWFRDKPEERDLKTYIIPANTMKSLKEKDAMKNISQTSSIRTELPTWLPVYSRLAQLTEEPMLQR